MILINCKKDISFLVATKTFETPIISTCARKMKSMAVQRPQDLAKQGTGKINILSSTEISGEGTLFTKEL